MRALTRGTIGRVVERPRWLVVGFVGNGDRDWWGGAIHVGCRSVARKASGRTRWEETRRGYKAERHIVGNGR